MARKLPPPKTTHQIEREYFTNILKYLAFYQSILKQELDSAMPDLQAQAKKAQIPTLREDSAADVLDKLFSRVQKRLAKAVPKGTIAKWAKVMADRANRLSKMNFSKHAKNASGAEIEPLLTDKGLSPYFKDRVATNVSLISSIPTRKHAELKNKLSAMLAKDATHKQIADMIKDHFTVTKSSAALIAQDQVGKINGDLDEHRQRQMGVTRYRWRTMKDMRVTGRPGGLYPDAHPSHWKREGEIFRWDSSPDGGHPKQRIRCRCYPEPVLEDILE